MSIFGNLYDNDATAEDIARGNAAASEVRERKYNGKNRLCDVDEVPLTIKGKRHVIKPKALSLMIKNAVSEIVNDPKTAWLSIYFEDEIILTFGIETACTDGKRIFMSPLWAHFLTQWGNNGTKEWEKTKEATALQKNADAFNKVKNNMILKYVKFTLIHEAYHILYQHVKRGAMKTADNSKHMQNRLNIAADTEINRDIEAWYPEYRGVTEDLNLIWFEVSDFFSKDNKPFEKEMFETIFDNQKEEMADKLGDPESGEENPDTTIQDDDDDKQSTLRKMYDNGFLFGVDAINDGKINPDDF